MWSELRGKEWGRTRARHGGAREREGGAGRRRVRGRLREQRGGAWGARRALTCGWVRVPASRQAKDDYRSYKRSALHLASAKGLAGTVAQLLALGADATLTGKVRAYLCISISTCIDLYTYKHTYTSVRYGMETRALVSGQFLDR